MNIKLHCNKVLSVVLAGGIGISASACTPDDVGDFADGDTTGDGDGDGESGWDSDESGSDSDESGSDSTCGDGYIDEGEECDDGNADNTDDCLNTCVEASCGDEFVFEGQEECDEGTFNSNTDMCTEDCTVAMCGDGFVWEGDEECDDGNASELDGCTTACTTSSPTLELSFSQIKQFEFSWAAVLGAEYYQLLESADVGEDFVQVGGDIVGESFELTVPLHFRLHASYKLRACDGGGCSESAVVDVVGSLADAVGYFKASNTDSDDHFGHKVALSGDGDTLAVGARGVVYVFARNGGGWSQQDYVTASNWALEFGSSVALSGDGDTLAVGAQSEGGSATGIDGNQDDYSSPYSGAVYVFVREAGVWSQQAYVKASNTDSSDLFGSSVALSGDGDTLAVGARGEGSSATGIWGNQADNSASQSGAVYVFARNGGAWSQQAYVKASNTDSGDRFGTSLALSGDGDTLAVGAYLEGSSATGIWGNQADNSAHASGAVYVFVRNGGAWSQQAYVKASNTDSSDFFGYSVALSGDGDTLAVGASYENSSATGIGGNQADNSADSAGAVYMFVRNGGAWSQQAYVKASNTESHDHFGWSVALSDDGDALAVGAVGEDSSATGIGGNQADNSRSYPGAVYVVVRNGGAWSQQAYVKASNTASGDGFGKCVALSGDGDTLAVGAPEECSSATGIGGNQADNSALRAGAVYLY